MPENSNQNKGIDFGRDIEELERKGKDRIWAQGQGTIIKTKGSNPSAMPENSKQKVGIESRRNAREPEKKKTKGSNPGAMSENPKMKKGIESRQQNEGNESGRDASELETKTRDRIRACCQRTRNKTKGSNPCMMSENSEKKRKGSNLDTMVENSNQNKGIKSGRDNGEPVTKGRDRN